MADAQSSALLYCSEPEVSASTTVAFLTSVLAGPETLDLLRVVSVVLLATSSLSVVCPEVWSLGFLTVPSLRLEPPFLRFLPSNERR